MHTTTYRRALTLLLSALGTLTATTVAAAPAQAAPTCTATYKVTSSWPAVGGQPAGFHGEFTLSTTPGTKTDGWRVEVHFRTGVEVRANWDSVMLLDADPTYVFGNAPWNFQIIPGSTKFGVTATKTANNISNTPWSIACAAIPDQDSAARLL
ncbi:cellulose-binding domain-containing protein [Micromonospora sp. CPCC 205371]|nr:cellulose-binding domain-containing protein [Micromonospora sp. CPCC 205371]